MGGEGWCDFSTRDGEGDPMAGGVMGFELLGKRNNGCVGERIDARSRGITLAWRASKIFCEEKIRVCPLCKVVDKGMTEDGVIVHRWIFLGALNRFTLSRFYYTNFILANSKFENEFLRTPLGFLDRM